MKSTEKLKNYLESYTREKYFMDRVFKIRENIGIPKNGIKFSEKMFDGSVEGIVKYLGMYFGIKYKNKVYLMNKGKISKLYGELLMISMTKN